MTATVLVTGRSGILRNAGCLELERTKGTVIARWSSEFDLRDRTQIDALFVLSSPDTVIHSRGGSRESCLVDDAAPTFRMALAGYGCRDLVNIGNGEEISIEGLAEAVVRPITGFRGSIERDTGRPTAWYGAYQST